MTVQSDPSTTPNLPPQSSSSAEIWDPITISNVIFSAVMVFTGIVAIWQAHCYHRRPRNALDLDEEEIIGIRVLSRTSTTSSSDTANQDSPLPSPQVALTTNEGQETVEPLTPADRVDSLDGAPVAPTSCL